MPRPKILTLLVVLIAASGCATPGVHHATASQTEAASATECYRGHRPPAELVIAVYLDNGRVHTVPERAIVEHPRQRVKWIAVNGEISNIVFEPSDCSPAPPSIPERARMHNRTFAPGHLGTHKYGFVFHPDGGGDSIEVDPFIIIEY
jgi:hypothetical protein